MCRSGNTEYEQNGGQKGENARIVELLIAVVTIYSVERRAPRRERVWSLAKKLRLRSNISSRDKARFNFTFLLY